MESFRWISVALSLILGLGMTRLLTSSVAVFRTRSRAPLDWIPFVWAGCIFLWQLQFWWAIIELPGLITVWTPVSFLTLVGLTLLLFLSAALVLPESGLKEKEGLRVTFEQDGRWGVVALGAYFALALLADWELWDVSPFSFLGVLLAALTILPFVFAWSRSRRIREAVTLLYVPLSLWSALQLSPASY